MDWQAQDFLNLDSTNAWHLEQQFLFVHLLPVAH
jgi:hypothetical protein